MKTIINYKNFFFFYLLLLVFMPNILNAQKKFDVNKFLSSLREAYINFTEKRDINSIKKFYTEDYTSYDEHTKEFKKSRDDIENSLKELKEQIELGNPVRYTMNFNNVQSKVFNDVIVTTAETELKVGTGGQVLLLVKEYCTFVILPKIPAITHEHCTKIEEIDYTKENKSK